MDGEGEIYVGVNIVSGAAFLGAVRCPDQILLDDGADRILPSEELDLPRRLEDFRARIAQELRRLQPAAVGVARTLKFKPRVDVQPGRSIEIVAPLWLRARGPGVHEVRWTAYSQTLDHPVRGAFRLVT